MRSIKPQSREAGAALIEIALLLPILLWFSLGAVDLGKVFRTNQLLQNAAREGARLSTLQQNKGNIVPSQKRVTSYLTVENTTSCASISTPVVNQSVLIPLASGVNIPASQVSVQCSLNPQFLHGLSAGIIPKTLNLVGQATFRNLY